MTILSAQSIRARHGLILPFEDVKRLHVLTGMSYGLSSAGYDVRIAQEVRMRPDDFRLANTVEKFDMPDDLIALVHDKSTLARMGLSLFNTVIEPGWRGNLTLELKNMSCDPITLKKGQPIAQVIFMALDQSTVFPYSGKYQDQPDEPVPARFEKADAAKP